MGIALTVIGVAMILKGIYDFKKQIERF